jgi:hypothetical protein
MSKLDAQSAPGAYQYSFITKHGRSMVMRATHRSYVHVLYFTQVLEVRVNGFFAGTSSQCTPKSIRALSPWIGGRMSSSISHHRGATISSLN